MVFRDDVEALALRHQQLESEVQDRIRERDDVAHMLAQARDRDAEARRVADLLAGGPRRRRRRRMMFAIVALVLLGAVFGGIKAYRVHREHVRRALLVATMARMHAFSNQMCQCTTNACAQGVMTELNTWGQEMAKSYDYQSAPKPSEEDIKDMSETMTRFGNCMTRAMGGSESSGETRR